MYLFTTQCVEMKQRKLKISQSDQHFIFCLHPGTAAGFTTYTVFTNCLIAHVVPNINSISILESKQNARLKLLQKGWFILGHYFDLQHKSFIKARAATTH